METVTISKGNLLSKAASRRSQLDESLSLQQFLRDAEEAKNWIGEKSKVAGDQTYKDPSNLEVKIQQHQDFEAELQANKGRIDAVVEMGKELTDAGHFATDEIKWVENIYINCIEDTYLTFSPPRKLTPQAHAQQGVKLPDMVSICIYLCVDPFTHF